AWAMVAADPGRLSWLFGVLALGVIGADLFGTGTGAQAVFISSSALAAIVLLALFGPAWAFAIVAVSELIAWAIERYRTERMAMNIVGSGLPVLIAGTLFEALRPAQNGSAGFYLALALAAALVFPLNLLIVAGITSMLDGVSFWGIISVAFWPFLGSIGINVLLALAATGLCLKLDIRDSRAARHAAAVAAFARDIASEAGMSHDEQELAHTAGLLHDIGNFALSDRVFERGRVLTDEDWDAIRQHPALGADMLRDLGLYGPVAEIVRAHHERVDGRGYPDRLKADQIPEIAKIIAVAEVYDTLTAHDTYRTPVSSFQALTELRRVAGSQLDADYVEALANVLAGSDARYRHADAADFGSELDLERRINEAAASG